MTSVTDTPLSDADLVTSAIPTAVAEEIARLRAENAALRQTVATLTARIAELERQLAETRAQAQAQETGTPVAAGAASGDSGSEASS